ncbi:MAG: rubredoxin-type Fe(Cys)4 protein [Desulfotalea sp.]|nr:MAG: rubredoxin-type Fe(Cys)4 protein [Desulfotalea sp.]
MTGTHDFRPNKQWRCTVCGYVHNGVEPPEKCPVCGADKSLFVELDVEGNAVGGEEEDVAAVAPGETVTDANKGETDVTLFSRISSLVLKLHLHPIHTHFPNGLIPVLVVFLGLAIYFDIAALETAAFFNSIAVLIVLPVVIFTGYIEWQKRYKGIKTAIFIVKIICSMLVLASVNVLVFWRIIDPNVAAEGSTTQMIYFAVALVALGAAGIAGHLGGKLVFAGRT